MAAAATVVMKRRKCKTRKDQDPKFRLVADHPFIFVLREKLTRCIIFAAKIRECFL